MQNHPLFQPLNDDDESPEVEAIHVTRFESGSYVWSPYKFAAEELTDMMQIFETFGGGKYELVARADNRISARRRYELAGRPKPLTGPAGADEPVAHAPVPVAAPQDTGMVGLLLQFMQQNAQQAQAQAQVQSQMFLAMMNQSTAMMTSMVNRDAESSKTLLQAMAQNNERALQGQAQVFQAMIEATGKGGGKDVLQAYRDGLGDGAGGGDSDKDDGDSITNTIGTMVEGLKIASSLAGGGASEVAEVVP